MSTMTKTWVAVGAVAALVGGFLFLLPEPGERQGPPPAAGFVVKDVRVFDGVKVLPVATVVVRDGRVAAVGPDVEVPTDLEVVDGRGQTLLPGLIDTHVHAYGDSLPDALNFGVTTVLDMHGDPATLRELTPTRDSLSPRQHADLFGAGWMGTVPKGHGTQFGFPVPTLSTPAEAAAFLDARFAEGSDWLKLAYEPKDKNGLGPPFPSLDLPTATALIVGAHERGRLAVAHVSRLWCARDMVGAGVDGLVHIPADQPVDRAFVEQAKARGIFVIPTLVVAAAFGGSLQDRAAEDPRLASYLTQGQREMLAFKVDVPRMIFNVEAAKASVRTLNAAGVDILAGSDAPNPGTAQGASLHVELALLVEAGLTPVEALAAATSVPARRFKLLADRGRIAPGSRADLLLVRGDPTADIRATRDIVRLWKNGAAVERRQYPAPQP
jgi:imidazolonepropionase-like amidohydrolase